MSYLSPLRLHFAGTFQASPSTVNNDPTHFNNATFKPEYRLRPAAEPASWRSGSSRPQLSEHRTVKRQGSTRSGRPVT